MLTVEQILENYSVENDIVVAVFGQKQFDDFMRLLDAQGYQWGSR